METIKATIKKLLDRYLRISGAVEIKAGVTYVIETPRYCNREERAYWAEEIYAKTGARFLILTEGAKIAR